jgi:hypothetical protein
MRCESDSEVVNVEKWVSEDDAGPGEPGMSACPWAGEQSPLYNSLPLSCPGWSSRAQEHSRPTGIQHSTA